MAWAIRIDGAKGSSEHGRLAAASGELEEIPAKLHAGLEVLEIPWNYFPAQTTVEPASTSECLYGRRAHIEEVKNSLSKQANSARPLVGWHVSVFAGLTVLNGL